MTVDVHPAFAAQNTHAALVAAIANSSKDAVAHCLELLADDVSLSLIPTGVCEPQSKQSTLAVLRSIFSALSTDELQQQTLFDSASRRLVVESIATVVHEEPLEWLLPGVKPTKKRATFPIILFFSFDATDRIKTVRVHWEMASVLRQIGCLPMSVFCKGNGCETTLPVVGPKIVDAMSHIGANNQAATVDTRVQVSDMEVQEVVKVQPAVGQATMSDILAGKAQEQSIRPSSRVLAQPGGPSSFNIFSSQPQPQITRRDPNASSMDAIGSSTNNNPQLGRKTFAAHYESSVSMTHNEHDQIQHQGKGRRAFKGMGESSIEFGHQTAKVENDGTRPSSRVLGPPGGNTSIFFG